VTTQEDLAEDRGTKQTARDRVTQHETDDESGHVQRVFEVLTIGCEHGVRSVLSAAVRSSVRGKVF
jgi:hypothetical protein